jgi:hypothetical protein
VKQAVTTQSRRFWEHIRSPITLRAFMAFLAITVLAYIAWRDISQYAANAQRDARLDAQFAQWQKMQESTERHLWAADMNTATATEQMNVVRELGIAIEHMAVEFREAREARETEHAEIIRQMRSTPSAAPQRKATRRSRTPLCWRLVETKKPFGDTDVVTKEYKRMPCAK